MVKFNQRKQIGGKRFYELTNGNSYASVTTVLDIIEKPGVTNWMQNTKGAKEKLEYSSKRGTSIHHFALQPVADRNLGNPSEVLADLDPGQRKRLMSETQRGVEIFQDWWGHHEPVPVAVEKPLWSDEYGYAGTADLITRLDGDLYVLDLKTGSGIYESMPLQAAAYGNAFMEMGGAEVDGTGVIRCSPKEDSWEFVTWTRDEMDKHFEEFEGVLDRFKKLMDEKSGDET